MSSPAGTRPATTVASPDTTQPGPRPRSLLRLAVKMPAAGFLILLMAIGSVVLWIGIPVGWVYGASQLVNTSQPTLGPYVLLIFGIPITMFLFGKLLYQLDRVFERLTGRGAETEFRAPWLKSMRGERNTGRRLSVLEGVMIVSVAVALVLFGAWFFLVAGSSLPT
ncbi:MAG: hypothetical protein QOJ07_637 [Thermoleophilaceae bacterium]|nr:hypothetical protein [Thermoleophilaceae bacterium]